MAFTCHITCGNSKKVVKFSNNTSVDVIGEVKRAFGLCGASLKSIKLEKFDEDWNDWVDIAVNELQHGLKIRVLTNVDSASVDQSPFSHSGGSASTVLLDDDSGDESAETLSTIFDIPPSHYATYKSSFADAPSSPCSSLSPSMTMSTVPLHSPLTAQSTAAVLVEQVADPLPVALKVSATESSCSHSQQPITEASTQDEDPDPKHVNKTVKDLRDETLPENFQFTSLPRRLVQKLESGSFPDERERRQIVTYVFNDMASFVVYPTSCQYNEVASSLVKRFPVLSEGSFSTTPYHYWKTRIMDKFRNERRNLKLPQKRKLPTSSKDQLDTSNSRNNELPEGEDAESQKRHQRWLEQESKKKNPDTQKASLLMGKTFFTRRQDMVDHPQRLSLWKAKYPFLFDTEELLAEFLRITQRNCKGKLRESVSPYFKIIEKADNEVLSLYREEMPKCKNAEELTDLKCITTLVTLPKMLKEEIVNILVLEDVCTSKKPLTSEPVILCKGQNYFNIQAIAIKTEDQLICKPGSLLQAFECLMATYYTFNMSFNPKSKNSLTFLDLLFGLKTKRMPRLIVTFMTKYKDL